MNFQNVSKSLGLFAALSTLSLAAAAASAQTECRCPSLPLSAVACDNALTADVFVWWGWSDAQSGNSIHRASVIEVYEGREQRSSIRIEVPRDCGLDLDSWTRYVVSLQAGGSADYTTFACNSFVAKTSDLSKQDRAFLLDRDRCAPGFDCSTVDCPPGETCEMQDVQCITSPCPPVPVCVPGPSACLDYSDRDFGLCEMVLGWAAVDGACTLVSGCGSDEPFYPNRDACMDSCAQDLESLCYRFEEANASAAVDLPCEDGLKCSRTTDEFSFDVYKYCKPMDFCISDATAETDCDGIPHVAVPGSWGCDDDNRCVYRWEE